MLSLHQLNWYRMPAAATAAPADPARLTEPPELPVLPACPPELARDFDHTCQNLLKMGRSLGAGLPVSCEFDPPSATAVLMPSGLARAASSFHVASGEGSAGFAPTSRAASSPRSMRLEAVEGSSELAAADDGHASDGSDDWGDVGHFPQQKAASSPLPEASVAALAPPARRSHRKGASLTAAELRRRLTVRSATAASPTPEVPPSMAGPRMMVVFGTWEDGKPAPGTAPTSSVVVAALLAESERGLSRQGPLGDATEEGWRRRLRDLAAAWRPAAAT